ncbi:MAG: beta-ketoacyl synthase N-terminal-like domain-containing protein [Bacteroidales bacterium]
MKHARIIASNIVCSLGFDTDEVFKRVVSGDTGVNALTAFDEFESVYAAQIKTESLEKEFASISPLKNEYTRFEKMAILSLSKAAQEVGIDLSDSKLLLILSTTKGNIDLLDKTNKYSEQLLLGSSAKVITSYFGNPNSAIVISNACISGVAALIEAQRYLADGEFKRIAIVGCDTLSKFVIAGFGCFHALAPNECRPFDQNREGLNLGEAAATIILDWAEADKNDIVLGKGAITNDSTHISAPSRTAEGLYAAIKRCNTTAEIDFILAHGTATPYNDPMEAIAISRANLQEVPTLSLKAIFGHTLGAAGVLETIIGGKMLTENILLPSRGFSILGVEQPIKISTEMKKQEMHEFLKTISGFGGCTASLLVKKIR